MLWGPIIALCRQQEQCSLVSDQEIEERSCFRKVCLTGAIDVVAGFIDHLVGSADAKPGWNMKRTTLDKSLDYEISSVPPEFLVFNSKESMDKLSSVLWLGV